jgi:signal transduction histidine kinase
MSLKARLVLAAAYVLTVVILGLAVPLAVFIQRYYIKQFEASVLTNATLLAARINDDLPAASSDPNTSSPARSAIARITELSARETGLNGLRFVVTDRDGRVISDTEGHANVGEEYATPGRPEFTTVFDKPGGDVYLQVRHSEEVGEDLIVAAVPVVHFRSAIGAVRATQPVGVVRRQITQAWFLLGFIGAIVLATGLGLAYVLASTVTRPLRDLETVAEELEGGDLQARARPHGPQEMVALAESFNSMATALASNIIAQQDFVANASHQLRTPLTGMRLRLEAIEGEGGVAGEQAAKAEAELDRLASLVQDLLRLARGSTIEEATGRTVDASARATDAVARWSGPAVDAGKTLVLEEAGRGTVWADPADLDNVLDNLIENAIRYAPAGARIGVSSGSRDGRVFLRVHDDGPGIPPEERDRVFERFYRGSSGRQSGPGTGLGLAIVFELVRRWDGDVKIQDGAGAGFEASFPAVPTVS